MATNSTRRGRGQEAEGMGRRKRDKTADALDKAVGRLTETVGTASGDKTLEAEGRATADGGWKVQVEGSRRATSVHKTKGEAVANAKELARSHQPSQLLVYKQNGTVQTEQTYG
jgi:uncharacterized protein YjbJ (UPF0337 family)